MKILMQKDWWCSENTPKIYERVLFANLFFSDIIPTRLSTHQRSSVSGLCYEFCHKIAAEWQYCLFVLYVVLVL